MWGFTSGAKYIFQTPTLVSGLGRRARKEPSGRRTRPRVKERWVTPTLNGCLGAFDALGESVHRSCKLLDTLRNVVYRRCDFLDYGRHCLFVDDVRGQITGGSWLERLGANVHDRGNTESYTDHSLHRIGSGVGLPQRVSWMMISLAGGYRLARPRKISDDSRNKRNKK